MGIFGNNEAVVIRAIRSPYMNLAHGIAPTAGGAWDSAPTGLGNLTDENKHTECVAGTDNDAAEVYIEIDLGQQHEVYVIEISNLLGHGFAAGAGGLDTDFTLKTVDDADNVTTRDTQNVLQDDDWDDITLEYNGDGIPVQKIRVCVTDTDGSGITMQPGEVAVYGS